MNRFLSPLPARRVGQKLASLAIFAVGLGVTGHAFGQLPESKSQGSVQYVSGGFGQEESSAFKAAQSQWPLALTFASADGATAAYAGDVQVTVVDQSGTTVLDVTSKGPYFLARLPDGQYTVQAQYDGERQSRKITIKDSAGTPLVIRFDRPAAGPD